MNILRFAFSLLLIPATSAIVNQITCPKTSIIPRSEWNATDAETKATKILHPERVVTYVVIHHTKTANCSTKEECAKIIKEIEKESVEVWGLKDVGAHFFVSGDDSVYEGRGWGVEGEDVPDCPFCLSIEFIGNFTTKAPSPNANTVVWNLIECGRQNKMIYDKYSLYGHRDLRVTDCPGNALYKAIEGWKNFYNAGKPILTTVNNDTSS